MASNIIAFFRVSSVADGNSEVFLVQSEGRDLDLLCIIFTIDVWESQVVSRFFGDLRAGGPVPLDAMSYSSNVSEEAWKAISCRLASVLPSQYWSALSQMKKFWYVINISLKEYSSYTSSRQKAFVISYSTYWGQKVDYLWECDEVLCSTTCQSPIFLEGTISIRLCVEHRKYGMIRIELKLSRGYLFVYSICIIVQFDFLQISNYGRWLDRIERMSFF